MRGLTRQQQDSAFQAIRKEHGTLTCWVGKTPFNIHTVRSVLRKARGRRRWLTDTEVRIVERLIAEGLF